MCRHLGVIQAGEPDLGGLPATSSTWDRLSEWGEAASELYWQRTPIGRVEDPSRDLQRAVESLMGAGRPYRALDLAGMWLRRQKRKKGAGQVHLDVSAELLVHILEVAPRQDPREEWFPVSLNQLGYQVSELLDILEDDGVELPTLAALEWSWMTALEHSRRGLKSLQCALSRDPELFVKALELTFRAENEEERELTERDLARAQQAFRMLEIWKTVPGSASSLTGNKDDEQVTSVVDEKALFDWVHEARRLAGEAGRLAICDSKIGNVLAYAPADLDGPWPCEPVRKVIEKIGSKELDRGIVIGVFNKRGAHWRKPGGDQERHIAAKYRSYAEAARSKWPRTFAILQELVDDYEREGRWHDERQAFEEFE